MIVSLSRLTGMPAVWQDQQVGLVERAVPDAYTGRLHGLMIRRGIGRARWASADDVLLAGESCVVLRRRPHAQASRPQAELRRVFLTTGECVGEVTDVLIHGDTLALCALEVCESPLARLMGRRGYAVEYRPSPAGEPGGVTAAGLLSWAQLRSYLGEEDDE